MTNTGNVTLSDVDGDRRPGRRGHLPADDARPGRRDDLHGDPARRSAGQYANVGSVDGRRPVRDRRSSDSDPSHYSGAAPGIDVEKATNGSRRRPPAGPVHPGRRPGDVDLRRAATTATPRSPA